MKTEKLFSENENGNNANTVLEYVICENCNKKTIKEKVMKVPECYFKGNKVFYVMKIA